MRLREPRATAPTDAVAASEQWEKFSVTVITPIYGGGVDAGVPDCEMPVRAKAIRNQLRFWWRLLARNRASGPLRECALFETERAIWGAMTEGGRDYTGKVKIRVRCDRPQLRQIARGHSERVDSCTELRQGNNNRANIVAKYSIPQYVSFPGQGKLNDQRTEYEENPADVMLPGLIFTLELQLGGLNAEQDKEVREALQWWASFGGIGARTRRGMGSVEVKDSNGRLLDPVTANDAAAFRCRLIQKNANADAVAAWNQAIERLREFRQDPTGRQNGRPPGRSHWPEPDSIRQITSRVREKMIPGGTFTFTPTHPARISFPRAAFGLPIIFHFQSKRSDVARDPDERSDVARDPDDCVLQPANEDRDRMASPLILKAMALSNGRYAATALLLPTDDLDDLELVIMNSGDDAHNPNLPKLLGRSGNDIWWPRDEAAQTQKANSHDRFPLRNHGSDALSAFMAFF